MLEYSVIAGLIGLASIVGLKSAGSTAQQTTAIIAGELGGEVNGDDGWEDDWEDEDDALWYWPGPNISSYWNESYIDSEGKKHNIFWDYNYYEDEWGNPIYTDEDGNEFYYDENGNRIHYDDDQNPFYFDEDGNAVYYDPENPPIYSYKDLYEVVLWTDEDGVIHLEQSNENGNLEFSGEMWTDENGVEHLIEKDASGNMLWESWTDEDGVMHTNQYDSNGLISKGESWTDEDGTYYSFEFDANGQLTKRIIETQDEYIWQDAYDWYDEETGYRETAYFDSNGMYHRDTYSPDGEDMKETYNDKGIMTESEVVYPSGHRAIGSLDDNGVWTLLSQAPSQDGSGYVTVFGSKWWESSNYPGKTHHQDIDAAGNVTGEYLMWETYADAGSSYDFYASHTQELDNEGLATGNITTQMFDYVYDDETGSTIGIDYTQQRDSESGSVLNAEATWVAQDGTSYKYTSQNKDGEGTYYYMSESGDWVEMAPEDTSQLQAIDHRILFYDAY